MSELQQHHDNFATGYWCDLDLDKCPCHGNGWALSQVDTWHQCPIHFNGQTHPECEGEEVIMDPLEDAVWENNVQYLLDQVEDTQQLVNNLTELLDKAQNKLADLQLELVNKTPTIRTLAVAEIADEMVDESIDELLADLNGDEIPF